MAATKGNLTKLQQDQVRAAIQTTQLVKRLQNYALGLPEANATDPDAPPVDLDGGRLKAIEILLKKSLPDLSSVAISNADDKPFKTEEVGSGAAKLAAFINGIAERSREAGEPDA